MTLSARHFYRNAYSATMALPPISNLKLNELGSCLMVLLQKENPVQFAPNSPALHQEIHRLQHVSLSRAVSMIQNGVEHCDYNMTSIPQALYRTNNPVIHQLLHEYTLRLKKSLLLPEHERFLAYLLQAKQQQQTPASPGTFATSSGSTNMLYSSPASKSAFSTHPPVSPLLSSMRHRRRMSPPANMMETLLGDSESSWSTAEQYPGFHNSANVNTNMNTKQQQAKVNESSNYKNNQRLHQPTPSPTNQQQQDNATQQHFESEKEFVDFCREWSVKYGSHAEPLLSKRSESHTAANEANTANEYTKQQLFTTGIDCMTHSYTLVVVGMQIRNSISQWETQVLQQANASDNGVGSPTSPNRNSSNLKQQGDALAVLIDQWKTQVERLGGTFLGVNAASAPTMQQQQRPQGYPGPPTVYSVNDDDDDDDDKTLASTSHSSMPAPTKRQPLKKRTILTTAQQRKLSSDDKKGKVTGKRIIESSSFEPLSSTKVPSPKKARGTATGK
ncbi:hypothetical protein MPSEU_001082600 [Mayamaea pseudoterrestris]|nr:hypothetical protein MPSEU_001082600 [Mayamaea pseudoterrestris]